MRINAKIANTLHHVAPLLLKEEVRQKLRDAIESRDPENLRREKNWKRDKKRDNIINIEIITKYIKILQRGTWSDMVRHGQTWKAQCTGNMR